MQVLLYPAILAGLLLNLFQLSAQSPPKKLQLKLNEPYHVTEETLHSVERPGRSVVAGRIFINLKYYYENGQIFFKIHFQPELNNPERNRILAFDVGGGSNDLFHHISELSRRDIAKGRDLPDHVSSFYQTSPKVLELQNTFSVGYVDFEQETAGELIFKLDLDNLPEDNTFTLLFQFYHGSYPRRQDRIEVHSLFRPFRYEIELVHGQFEIIDSPGLQAIDKPIATVDCQKWYKERYADLEMIKNKLIEGDFSSRLTEIEIIINRTIGNNTARYKAELSERRETITTYRDHLNDLNSIISEKANECKEQTDSLMSSFSLIEDKLDNLIMHMNRLEGLITGIDSKVAEYDQDADRRPAAKYPSVEESVVGSSQQTFSEGLNEVMKIYDKVNSLRLSEQFIDSRLHQELREDRDRLKTLKRQLDQTFGSLTADVQPSFLTSYKRLEDYYTKTLAILNILRVETASDELPQSGDVVKKAEKTDNSFRVLAYILIVIVIFLSGFIIFVRFRARRIMNKQINQSRPPAVNKLMSTSRRVKGAASKAKRLKIK